MISDDAVEWVRRQNWHSNEHPISAGITYTDQSQSNPMREGMATFTEAPVPLEIEARNAAIRDEDGLLLWFTKGFELGGQLFNVQYCLGWDHHTVQRLRDFLEPTRIDRVEYKIANYVDALNWRKLAQYGVAKFVVYAPLPYDPGLTDVGYYRQDGQLCIKGLIRIDG